jgi:hypothetical protein
MLKPILKFALCSALIAPPIGMLLIIPILGVLAGQWPIFPWEAFGFLVVASPIAVPVAYVIGGPAAFITGATAKYLSLRAYNMPAILAAATVIAAGVSALTYLCGVIIVSQGPAARLSDALVVATTGAVTTLICAAFYFFYIGQHEARDGAA